MSQSVLRPFPAAPAQLQLVRRAVILGLVALTTLLAVGAQNQISLTVLPGVAFAGGLAVDEYNLYRRRRGRSPLWHGLCAGLVGAAVLIAALVVFSAT